MRRHRVAHAAEVMRLAPLLRTAHLEWARTDFLPTLARYWRTTNAAAFRGAANAAVRYRCSTWRG